MAPPHHLHAGVAHRLDERCRLWIVKYHDVARPDEREQLLDIAAGNALVVASFCASERSSVAASAVEMIVQALGDLEKPLVALDDRPACVDSGALPVREERL